MYANDTKNFVDEPIHSMPLQPAAAAKPSTRTLSLDWTPSLWSAKIAISSFASNIPDGSVRERQLVQVVYGESIAIHPHCLSGGRLLVNIYFILHPMVVEPIPSTNATKWNIILRLPCVNEFISHHIIWWNPHVLASGSHIQKIFIHTARKQTVCVFKGSLSLPPKIKWFLHSEGSLSLLPVDLPQPRWNFYPWPFDFIIIPDGHQSI